MNRGHARARANIALVKYWGKRDPVRNLPATGSLSLTLDGLSTWTEVTFRGDLDEDRLSLDGVPARPEETARVRRVLDEVRRMAGLGLFAQVISRNDFPTGSGLASSASGMAALAVAAAAAARLPPDLATWSMLARLGSGSAPRSLLGGLVFLPAGAEPDGSDCVPSVLRDESSIPWRMVLVLTDPGRKKVGSREGMERTRRTSPYYEAWIRRTGQDLILAREAARNLDLPALGPVMEANAFAMHACAMASSPPLIYWNGTTLEVIRQVRELRREGLQGWLTMDAGPHVQVLCETRDAPSWAESLRSIPGVRSVRVEAPGSGPEVLP
ncbi:diphosphomevalonate decarboxylase [Myxococcota bacterium]|nr:diphosphomevalonate decarboxylase [Myxococcota bacterium]